MIVKIDGDIRSWVDDDGEIHDEQMQHECARAERGPDFVRLYDAAGALMVECSGIRSFEGYHIEGGAWTEVTPDPDYTAFLAGMMEGYGND